jgi:hypothetical protein
MDPDRIRIGIQPKMLDPDPVSNYPDPKHCLKLMCRVKDGKRKGANKELRRQKKAYCFNLNLSNSKEPTGQIRLAREWYQWRLSMDKLTI